jgi:uncharacterized protein (TIGR00299 family) protein
MHTVAFDGRMGASGDMLLGALVAAGADTAVLAPVERRLDVAFDIGTTTRCGIEATNVTVLATGDETDDGMDDDKHPDSHNGIHSHDGHSHDGTADSDDHGPHSHAGRAETHDHAEGGGPHRSFPEVLEIVDSLDLSESVTEDAVAIFELLGEAEASVHGTSLSETQFHEVGADDAIADIVGTALLLDDLDPDRVVTTPVAAGGGEVETSHGVYPVPAPAVTELAGPADWSLRGGPVEAELLTPTGAAILAHVASGVETLPALAVEASGYGAGDARFERPNVLRALVGETTGDLRREAVTVLETNLDDATPEALGGLQETLEDAGALDVSVLPATMKKSRPGHLVKVIVSPENARQVARKLAAETGTLGVREHGAGHRFVADREQTMVTLTIDGDSFDVAVKLASFGDESGGSADGNRSGASSRVYDVSAEYDDALAVARETGVPVREVRRRAEQTVRDRR